MIASWAFFMALGGWGLLGVALAEWRISGIRREWQAERNESRALVRIDGTEYVGRQGQSVMSLLREIKGPVTFKRRSENSETEEGLTWSQGAVDEA